MTPVWRSVRFCPVDDRANGRKTKRGTETRGVRTLSRVIGFHWSARCRTRASLQPKLPSNEHSTDLCTPYSGETVYVSVGINQWRVGPMQFIFLFMVSFIRLLLLSSRFIQIVPCFSNNSILEIINHFQKNFICNIIY